VKRLVLVSASALGLAGCAALDPGKRPAAGATTTERPASHVQPPEPAAHAERGDPVRTAMPLSGTEQAPSGPWARLRAQFQLDDVAHERVDEELARYAGAQGYFDAIGERAAPYFEHILERIEARGLPAELLLVPVIESAFRPFAYSYSSAGGLWQFKPATARHYGVEMNWWYDGRRDVIASTRAALDYFAYLHDFFDGDWLLAIAAYNAGEGTVRRAVTRNRLQGRPTDFWHLDLPEQTERYVPRLLALRRIVAEPGAHGVALPGMDPGRALELVRLPGQVDLARAAQWAGVDIDTLYRYNAGFNRWATAPDGPHRLAVPTERASTLRAALERHGEKALVRWRRHRVGEGETLSAIAASFDTTVEALRRANDLSGSLIRAGDHLLVPVAARSAEAYALSARNRREAAGADGPDGRERVVHRVRAGDTFWSVARRHGVEVRALADWNGKAPGDPIHPGERLVVWVDAARAGRGGPGERIQRVTYEVRRGDSLFAIARQFNLAVADIRRWNDLEAGAPLQPGQRLELRVDVTEQAEAG
jgi:membrane-bound lytic murein transglycosylase D